MTVLIPLPSAARTASADGPNQNIDPDLPYAAYLSVSAASGTNPTLDVVIQESFDGGANWTSAVAFAQATGTGRQKVTIPAGHAPMVRASTTIGGTDTPTFTYEVRIIHP